MKRARASCLILLLAAPAAAGVKAGGYLKDFWQYSHSALDGRAYNLNTARARLTLDADKALLKFHADYDQQVAAGSFFRTREFQSFGYEPPKPWLDMEQTISTGTTNGWGHGAYRAWVGIEDERGVVRAGRQRIAWGTGKLWNPTDILNPYDPASVERDERRGVDALYARAGVGALGQAELAWAPGDVWVDHALLARGRANWEGWDGSFMGGKIPGSTSSFVLGGDFAGGLFEGTAHGEVAWFSPENRTPYWKAGVGYDYSFVSGAALVVELYHAGNGALDPARYDFAALRAGKEPGVARHYAGATFSKDLHALVKLECASIVNADDGSTLAYPSLSWNAVPDLWLTAAWRRFGGDKISEYGRQPNQAVLSAQYWF
ncbi:MAG: hypothetical protein HY403_04445 [Elusimicrobia bacterium]|nr:hypothetical protein [Elusimicrobiota bacterium]